MCPSRVLCLFSILTLRMAKALEKSFPSQCTTHMIQIRLHQVSPRLQLEGSGHRSQVPVQEKEVHCLRDSPPPLQHGPSNPRIQSWLQSSKSLGRAVVLHFRFGQNRRLEVPAHFTVEIEDRPVLQAALSSNYVCC